MKILFYRIISTLLLGGIYSVSLFLRLILSRKVNNGLCENDSILVVGTFHNPNWFISHIRPLSDSFLEKIIVVCDEPVAVNMDNVMFACPPPIVSRVVGRAFAKFIWSIYCGFMYRPSLYMGYHIFPGAVTAQIVATIFRKPSCYQNTSGFVELDGGGWMATNTLLTKLSKPSRLINFLVKNVVCSFDLIIVRGTKAERYIRSLGYKGNVYIITGSVKCKRINTSFQNRTVDVMYVGRLSETKRPELVVRIAKKLIKSFPDIKVVLVGDGEKKEILSEIILQEQLQNNVCLYGKIIDVLSAISNAKVFLLTSRSEGLSIAMLEAMSVGTVPVVSNVGDLQDVVYDGKNGFLVEKDDMESFVFCIEKLLGDKDLWCDFSKKSIHEACNYSSISVVTEKWNNAFLSLN